MKSIHHYNIEAGSLIHVLDITAISSSALEKENEEKCEDFYI